MEILDKLFRKAVNKFDDEKLNEHKENKSSAVFLRISKLFCMLHNYTSGDKLFLDNFYWNSLSKNLSFYFFTNLGKRYISICKYDVSTLSGNTINYYKFNYYDEFDNRLFELEITPDTTKILPLFTETGITANDVHLAILELENYLESTYVSAAKQKSYSDKELIKLEQLSREMLMNKNDIIDD